MDAPRIGRKIDTVLSHYRALDLAVVEQNTYALTGAAPDQTGLAGVYFGSGASGATTNVLNVVVRDNVFALAAVSTGVTFEAVFIQNPDAQALFDNTWGAAKAFSGNPPGAILEVPGRVIHIDWSPTSSFIFADFPVRNAGTSQVSALKYIPGADWFTASTQAKPSDQATPGTVRVELNNAVLQRLGNGTYSAPLLVQAPGLSSQTVTIEVTVTGNGDVGPFNAALPMLRQSTATVIQAEDYDLGGQGKGYVDLTPAVDHVRLVFVSGGGGSSANIDRFRIAPVDRTLAGKAVLGEATGSNTIEIGTCFAVGVPGSISELRFYLADGESGSHTLRLWGPAGDVLASKLYEGPNTPGWHAVTLSQPVTVTPNLYTVSVEAYTNWQKTGVADRPLVVTRPGVLSFVSGAYAKASANYPNLPLYDYAMTDVEFTPSYAT